MKHRNRTVVRRNLVGQELENVTYCIASTVHPITTLKTVDRFQIKHDSIEATVVA